MRNIKLTIEYDGTNYKGWQIQPRNQRTIQGEITAAAKKVFNEDIKLIGSGRTDSGVHALGQVANFKTHSKLDVIKIKNALNAHLDKDIRIINAEDAPRDFHAQYSAKRKTYRYSICLRDTPNPFHYRYFLHFPRKLNLKHMREEAECLTGKKDFRSFMATDPALGEKIHEKDTIRTIYRLDIKKRDDLLMIEIEANGFLYKMVRNIVGTLLEIGTGKLPAGSMKTILKQKKRESAGDTAKPEGLTLVKVDYAS